MTDYATDYIQLAERFGSLADRIQGSAWDRPSPCEEWTAAGVVDHLVETQRHFLSEHGFDVADTSSEQNRAVRWRRHSETAAALVADPEVANTRFEGFFGPATVGDTLARFYGFDMIVHRWDLGQAAGLDVTFTDEEMDRIEESIDGFGEHLYREGICHPPKAIPADASRQEVLLARMGRDPNWAAVNPRR